MVQDVRTKLNLGLPWQKQLSKKNTFSQQIGLKLKEETSKVLHLKSIYFGSETWKFWKVDQKCLKRFEMWCWKRMYKISWNGSVSNKQVLRRVQEDKNIPQTIKSRKANRICNILRRNCLIKHITEGKIEGKVKVTGRLGRRRKELLDDLKEKVCIGNWMTKYYITLSGKLTLEDSMDLSQERLKNECLLPLERHSDCCLFYASYERYRGL
jgi:hypothetical protein